MSTAIDRFADDATPHCAGLRVYVLYVSGEFTACCSLCGKLGPTRREYSDAIAAWNAERQGDTRIIRQSGPSTSLIAPT